MSRTQRFFRGLKTGAQALPFLQLLVAGCQAVAPQGAISTQAVVPVAEASARVAGADVAKVVPDDGIPTLKASSAPGALAAPEYEADSLLVALAPGKTASDLTALDGARGLTVLGDLSLNGHAVFLVGVPSGDTPVAVRHRLAAAPGVTGVYLNTKAYAFSAAPNDEYYDRQWAHKPGFANTEGAWARVASDHVDASHVVIAVVDSGVDSDHFEFAGRTLKGINATAYSKANPTTDPVDFTGDQFGHGTFAAGIAAAEGNNAQAIAGVAWKAKVLPIKVDHPERHAFNDPRLDWGKFDLADIVAGLKWTVDHRDFGLDSVRVINMSLGQNTTGLEPLYVEAVAYARRKGILVVAATGNNGADLIPPPANTPGVVAVGATSHYLNTEYLSPDSNYGARLDLVAPGGGILSTVPIASMSSLGSRTRTGKPDDSFFDFRGVAYASGTSEAAPYVTGVAALVFAKYDPGNASLKTGKDDDAAKMVDAVRAHLLKSCDQLGAPGWNPTFGWGRINADKALADALPLPDGTAPTF